MNRELCDWSDEMLEENRLSLLEELEVWTEEQIAECGYTAEQCKVWDLKAKLELDEVLEEQEKRTNGFYN